MANWPNNKKRRPIKKCKSWQKMIKALRMSNSKSAKEIDQQKTNLVETQVEKERVLKILDLLGEEKKRINFTSMGLSTALKETVTNIAAKIRDCNKARKMLRKKQLKLKQGWWP
jgi:hypothetical protein